MEAIQGMEGNKEREGVLKDKKRDRVYRVNYSKIQIVESTWFMLRRRVALRIVTDSTQIIHKGCVNLLIEKS